MRHPGNPSSFTCPYYILCHVLNIVLDQIFCNFFAGRLFTENFEYHIILFWRTPPYLCNKEAESELSIVFDCRGKRLGYYRYAEPKAFVFYR